MEPAKKWTKYNWLDEWTAKFNGAVVRGKDANYGHCVICKRDIKVAASGIYDLKEHFKSNLHIKNVRESEKQRTMDWRLPWKAAAISAQKKSI